MKKSLTSALLANDCIKTTQPRAKAIRTDVDRVITWAKKGDLHPAVFAIAKLGDKELVCEVFEKAAQGMWEGRNGGYTRIMKRGPAARATTPRFVIIAELVTEPVQPKAKKADSVKPVGRCCRRLRKPAEAEEAPAEAAAEETPQSSICCIGAHVREVLGNQGLSSAIEELCPCGKMLLRDWEYVACGYRHMLVWSGNAQGPVNI